MATADLFADLREPSRPAGAAQRDTDVFAAPTRLLLLKTKPKKFRVLRAARGWQVAAPRAKNARVSTERRLKKPWTVYLEPEQVDQLKKLSELTKVPMAEYVRAALDGLLAEHKALLVEQQELPL